MVFKRIKRQFKKNYFPPAPGIEPGTSQLVRIWVALWLGEANFSPVFLGLRAHFRSYVDRNGIKMTARA